MACMNPPEILRILERLVESDGWKWLMTVAKDQVSGRTDEIMLKPAGSMDNCLGQEYLKGEVSGIRLFQALPMSHIASLRAQLATQTEEPTDESSNNA